MLRYDNLLASWAIIWFNKEIVLEAIRHESFVYYADEVKLTHNKVTAYIR